MKDDSRGDYFLGEATLACPVPTAQCRATYRRYHTEHSGVLFYQCHASSNQKTRKPSFLKDALYVESYQWDTSSEVLRSANVMTGWMVHVPHRCMHAQKATNCHRTTTNEETTERVESVIYSICYTELRTHFYSTSHCTCFLLASGWCLFRIESSRSIV